jgi:hypothetical protein
VNPRKGFVRKNSSVSSGPDFVTTLQVEYIVPEPGTFSILALGLGLACVLGDVPEAYIALDFGPASHCHLVNGHNRYEGSQRMPTTDSKDETACDRQF